MRENQAMFLLGLKGVKAAYISYQPVSLAQFHAALAHEAGPEIADLLTDLCREVFDGRNESLADGVQRALGRPPRDFSDFVRSAAAAGLWRPVS